jgi:hypothetical protein
LTQISFGQFYNSVKDRLTDSQLRMMDGNDLCFESEGTFLSISLHNSTIWVAWVVGEGVKWMHELKTMSTKAGFKFVQFQTKADNLAVNAIARYWKAKSEIQGDFVIYTIDTETR